MARTRSAGYDDQLDEILRSAARLFALQGYTATSMNQVAAACGVSKAALYHDVPDKQALLLRITAGHVARLERLVDEVAAAAADGEGHEASAAEARLRRLILRFVEEYADAQDAHRVLTEDVRFLDAPARREVQAAQRRVVAAFADAIATVRPALDRNALARPLAMLLFGMINWMFTWLKPDGALSHAQMAPVVADLFFGGLAAVRRPPAARAPRPPRRAATMPPIIRSIPPSQGD